MQYKDHSKRTRFRSRFRPWQQTNEHDFGHGNTRTQWLGVENNDVCLVISQSGTAVSWSSKPPILEARGSLRQRWGRWRARTREAGATWDVCRLARMTRRSTAVACLCKSVHRNHTHQHVQCYDCLHLPPSFTCISTCTCMDVRSSLHGG